MACCKLFIFAALRLVLASAASERLADKQFDKTVIPSEPHHQVTTDESRVVWPWRSYKTSHHTPPDLKITHFRGIGRLAEGYVFLSPADANKNDGTYDMSGTGFVMDWNGDLIFAGDEDAMDFCDEWIAGMTDFRAQDYDGRRYITYWNGCNTRGAHWGHRWGRVTFIDEEYNKFTLNPELGINTLEPAARGNIDVHEHQMTDRGTMVVTSYNNTQYDLTSIGGPADAWVADGMFFELDPKTGEVLFEWRALEHLDINDSHYGINSAGAGVTQRVPWDWLHINSVQRVGDNYLISARHHFAVYLISGKDGSMLWKLDGIDGGSFGSIPVNFRWQHHARAHNVTADGMTISLFNNMVNGPHNANTQTNGLAFWLSLPPDPRKPPVLVKKLQARGDMLFSGTQGSFQMDLGNGNSFMGYGTEPVVREYGPRGEVLWQAQFGEEGAVMNYRGFKMPWHGTPKHWDPVILVENPREHVPRVYASWNGATQISGWAVFAGTTRNSLKSVGVAQKKAFETVFEVGQKTDCVQVGAIRDGRIIRMSNIACLSDKVIEVGLAADVSRLKAENAQLQEKLHALNAMDAATLDAATWDAYKLLAIVAGCVVVVVSSVWGFLFVRDLRLRRRQYEPVAKEAW